jgi:hypothetical protein
MRNTRPARCGASIQRSWTRELGLYLSLVCAAFGTFGEAHATSLFRWDNRRENPGVLRLVPEISFLSTTENYDHTGTKVVPTGLTSYKKTGLDLWGIYGITRNLSAFARVSMASVSFDSTSGSETITGSGSGLTEQGLGLNYRLWETKVARNTDGTYERQSSIDGQFQLDIPLYDNVSARTSSPRQPLRGDGSLDITAGAFATVPFNQGSGQRLFGLGGLGYTIRSNNYSKAIPYQLQLVGLPERSGFLYRAGFHGFKSLGSDLPTGTTYSPQAAPNGTLDEFDAGRSLIVDALNSSYLTARLTAGYQWGPGNQLYATYVHPMSGTSTAVLKGYILGAQFRMNSGSGAKAASAEGATRARATYDLEARVKQANDRLNLIKIDRGSNDGIERGNVIDIYRTGANGAPADLVARGVVTSVTETEAVVNLRQYKKEVWVQAGYIARRITPKKNP